MLTKEIIYNVFEFKPMDIVPHHIKIGSSKLKTELDNYYGSEAWQEKIAPYIAMCGADGAAEDLGNNLVRDSFGTVKENGNIPHAVEPALPEPSLKGYKWPEPEEIVNIKKMQKELEGKENKFTMFCFRLGIFERAMQMRGTANFLMDMIDKPDFVHAYAQGYADLKIRTYEYLLNELEVDAIFGGGDDCDQRGCIMGPERWQEFIKPYLAQEIAHVHKLGKRFVMHSCGNVFPIIDDLVEIGIDGLDPIQPEPMDIFKLKEKLRKKVVMIGGMGSQQTLPFGTPDEIREQTGRLIRGLGADGGYILGNAKPMFDDTPVENAVAFIEEALQGESVNKKGTVK